MTAKKKTKRSVPRLIGRIALIALAVVLLLVLLVVGVLHTGPGQRLLRDKVRDSVAEKVNGEVDLEEMDFTLFGSIALRGLAIRNSAGEDAVAVGELAVELQWGSLLGDQIVIDALTLADVTVAIDERPDGTTTLTDLFKPSDSEPSDKSIVLKKLDVHGINITVDKQDGTHIAIKDLGIAGAVSALPAENLLMLTIERLGLGLELANGEGLAVDIPSLETGISVDANGDNLRASFEGFMAQATVVLPERPDPVVVPLVVNRASVTLLDGELDATMDGMELAALTLGRLHASGSIPKPGEAIAGNHAFNLSGLHVDAKELNHILGKEVLRTNVDVNVTVTGPPDAVDIKGSVVTGGGTLQLSGNVDISDMARLGAHRRQDPAHPLQPGVGRQRCRHPTGRRGGEHITHRGPDNRPGPAHRWPCPRGPGRTRSLHHRQARPGPLGREARGHRLHGQRGAANRRPDKAESACGRGPRPCSCSWHLAPSRDPGQHR